MEESSGKLLLKGVMSGVIVAIACVVYLVTYEQTGSKILGGLLFSLALIIIISRDYALYTGRIGYLLPYKKGGFVHILKVLFSNILGIGIAAVLLRFSGISENGVSITKMANNVMQYKLSYTWYQTFILAIFCGILMYIAVDSSKTNIENGNKIFLMIGAVLWFLVACFEHSIAGFGYLFLGNTFSIKAFLYLFIMIGGNAVGAITMNLINNKVREDLN